MNNHKSKKPSCWNNRTSLERILIVAIVVILTIGSILAFIMIEDRTVVEPEICKTTSCVLSAAEILDFVDPTHDPCDNFYQFACGRFNERDEEALTKLKKIVKGQYKTLFEQPVRSDDRKIIQAQKKTYQACMDEDKIEHDGLNVIKHMIYEIGGWPVVDDENWNDRLFDWKRATYILRQYGFPYSHFLHLQVVPDKNSSGNILQISEPFWKDLIKDEHKQAYEDYMVNVTVKFGANRLKVRTELRQVLEFQNHLAMIINETKFERCDLPSNRMTIAELDKNSSFIPWIDFINRVLYPSVQLSYDDEVLFPVQKYVEGLENLLNKTEKRVQANYIIWNIFEVIRSLLPKELQELRANYTKLTQDGSATKLRKTRQQFCLQMLIHGITFGVESFFNYKHSTAKKRDHINEIIENVKSELEQMVDEIKWMDEETKEFAREKANAITNLDDCPDDFFPEDLHTYDKLENEPDNIFKILTTFSKITSNYEFRNLLNSNRQTLYWQYCTYGNRVNAFYLKDLNKIQISPAMAQGILFDENGPRYKNYGALGTIIGHELAHAFSIKAAGFGKDGENIDWWTNATYEGYENAIQCLIEQSDNFSNSQAEWELNGNETIDENLADLAGNKAAYLAYAKWLEENGEEDKLPGLDYTSKQLFWIYSAIYYCGKYDSAPISESCSSSHDRDEFRVAAPLWNIAEFSQDFNCPSGSYMNPLEKCYIY